MHKLAKDRGGKCLSEKYINAHIKLIWQCKEGHTWEATTGSVRNGNTWCPTCAGNVLHTIKDMKELAKSKGGACLSKKYVNTHTKMKWKCKEGHTWMTEAIYVITGHWCHECGKIKSIESRKRTKK